MIYSPRNSKSWPDAEAASWPVSTPALTAVAMPGVYTRLDFKCDVPISRRRVRHHQHAGVAAIAADLRHDIRLII